MPKPPMSLSELETHVRHYLETQRATNPRFSLRNQARRWGVPFSTIQKLATGKRGLGFITAKSLALKFDIELIAESRSKKRAPSKWTFTSLDPESEHQVNWVNLAILEMLKLKDFEPNATWFSNRLGLDESDLADAITSMNQHGLLETSDLQWRDRLGDSAVATHQFLTSTAVRRSLKDVVSLSREKIEEVPYDLREHSFSLFPVTESQLPKLKKKLADLRREFTQEVQGWKGEKDQIYAFQIGFFPLTRKGDNK